MSARCRACFVRDNPPPRPEAAYLAAVADHELGLSANLCDDHTRAMKSMKEVGRELIDADAAPLGARHCNWGTVGCVRHHPDDGAMRFTPRQTA